MRVLGRADGPGPVGHLGRYRARDGSAGARVGVDLNRPHVVLVVGKRGYGKSYTLGVLAEELARSAGVRPLIGDTMGAFQSLAASDELSGGDLAATVPANALSPPEWCALVGVDPERPAGSLVWRAATNCDTLAAMAEYVGDADANRPARRAARNHLRLADSWRAFAETAPGLFEGEGCARFDLAGRQRAAINAIVAGVAGRAYDRRVADPSLSMPWLLLNEAHVCFDGVASTALRRLLTRGRQPGVSLVAATQRPSALPAVAVSQADLLVVHRLTSEADREALAAARPAYMSGSLDERMPTGVGEALVIDDATETVHTIAIRERDTPHDGASPRAVEGGEQPADTDAAIETVE